MKPTDIANMMDAIQAYGEMLGGMKKQIMSQGFSEEIAEQMVLEILKRSS